MEEEVTEEQKEIVEKGIHDSTSGISIQDGSNSEDPSQEIATNTGTSTELIDKANAAAERLEIATKEHNKAIAKEEALKVERTLGGSAEAGSQNKTKEQKEIESARALLAGTGFDNQLFPIK